MGSEWPMATFGEISEGIYDGPHATPKKADSGHIFLRIDNLHRGGLDLSDIRWIGEDDWPRWTKRVTPQPEDIVFSYEANLGLFALILTTSTGASGVGWPSSDRTSRRSTRATCSTRASLRASKTFCSRGRFTAAPSTESH